MKLAFKLLVIFLPPLIVVFLLYPLSGEVISSENVSSEFKIDNLFEEKQRPTVTNLIGDIFATSLNLDWYKVWVKNNSNYEDPNCLVKDGLLVQKFTFIAGEPRKYSTSFTESVVDTSWGPMESKYPDYYLKSGEERYFIAPSSDLYSIIGGVAFWSCSLTLAETNEGHQMTLDMVIKIKPYLPAWFAKLIVIFVAWLVMLASFVSILDWLLKKK